MNCCFSILIQSKAIMLQKVDMKGRGHKDLSIHEALLALVVHCFLGLCLVQVLILSFNTLSQTCGVCSRTLSQRSPWSSNRMVGSATDCAVVGVLVCGHVYHAECLEQATPESLRQDPSCPQCGTEEKPAPKVVNSEPFSLRGGAFRANGVLTTSRNKLSRIGAVPDELLHSECTSSRAGSYGGKGILSREGAKLWSQGDTSQSDRQPLNKSLSRKQLSFRNWSLRESSSDVRWRPASPARVSPETSGEDSIALTKKSRSSSFRLMRKR